VLKLTAVYWGGLGLGGVAVKLSIFAEGFLQKKLLIRIYWKYLHWGKSINWISNGEGVRWKGGSDGGD